MPASSSATITVGSAMAVLRSDARLAAAPGGQPDPECGTALQILELDHAAVVADDLGHERQAKPGARGLARDERIEQVAGHVLGDPRSVVLDLDHDRQLDPLAAVRHAH